MPYAPAELVFRGWLDGPAPAPQQLTLPGLQGGIWPEITASGPVASLDCQAAGCTVTMVRPDALGLGAWPGALQVWAARSQVALDGSPWTVPIRYEVGPPALVGLPSSLSVDVLLGQAVPAEPPSFLLDGAPDAGPWTAAVESICCAAPWLAVTPAAGSGVPATVSLQVLRAPASDFAWDEATILVTRAGQSVPIRVTRSPRHPAISGPATPVDLSIMANQAFLPAFTIRVDTEGGAATEGSVEASYDPAPPPGGAGWLAFDWPLRAPEDHPFRLATSALPLGRYEAQLKFTATGGSTFTVPVTLRVEGPGPTLSPTALTFRLDAAATPGDLLADLALAASAEPISWTATTDVPWLRVTPAGTTAPGATSRLVVEVVPAAIAAHGCAGTAGRVEVSADAGAGTGAFFRVGVQLVRELPCLLAIGPGRDPVGSSAEVAIIGDFLEPAPRVLFDDVPATSVRAVTRNELRVTPPPLVPGIHQVTLPTGVGAIGAASYQVMPAAVRSAAALASTGRKSRLFFDDATGRLWAVNGGARALERYEEAGGWTRTAKDLPGLVDAVPALAEGGLHVIQSSWLSYLDTANWPSGAVFPLASVSWTMVTLEAPLDGHVVLAGDPSACGATGCPPLDYLSGALHAAPVFVTGTRLGASRSGVRLVVAEERDRNSLVAFWSAAAPGSVAAGMSPFGTWSGTAWSNHFAADHAAMDRHGDSALLVRDGSVSSGGSLLLDGSGQIRPGQLPATVATALLTQAGDRAIAFDGVSRTVRIFDLASAADLATGEFPEVGARGGFDPGGDPGGGEVMTLSADDRTLFLGGDERILVVPLP